MNTWQDSPLLRSTALPHVILYRGASDNNQGRRGRRRRNLLPQAMSFRRGFRELPPPRKALCQGGCSIPKPREYHTVSTRTCLVRATDGSVRFPKLNLKSGPKTRSSCLPHRLRFSSCSRYWSIRMLSCWRCLLTRELVWWPRVGTPYKILTWLG